MILKKVPLHVLPYVIVLFSFYFIAHFIQIQLRTNKLTSGKMPVQSIQGIVDAFYDEDVRKITSMMGVTPAGSMMNATTSLAGINSAEFCYCIKVNERRFYVEEATYNLFEKGKEYIIYYIRTLNIPPEMVIPQGTLVGAIIVSTEECHESKKE